MKIHKNSYIFYIDTNVITEQEFIDLIDRYKSFYQFLHREDGPAIISRSDHYAGWYNHGILHNLNGPAVETKDGFEYWIWGKRFFYFEYVKIIEYIKENDEVSAKLKFMIEEAIEE